MAARPPSSCRCGCPHAALIPIYWNRANPVRLPLLIIHGVNASDHRFGGFGFNIIVPDMELLDVERKSPFLNWVVLRELCSRSIKGYPLLLDMDLFILTALSELPDPVGDLGGQ